MATLVEGDPKAPFSIATTPRCRGECYSISRIAPLYLWFSPYSAECLARQHQVLLDFTWDWTSGSWTIGEYLTHEANGLVLNSAKIELKLFHVVAVSILLYGYTTWTLKKKKKNGSTQRCCLLFWTNPGSSILML